MEHMVFSEAANGLSIERVIRDHRFTMPTRHLHDDLYEVYYLMDGERYYFVETKTLHLSKGSLLFINKNAIHKTAHAGRAYHDRILLLVPAPLLESLLPKDGSLSLGCFFDQSCISLALDEAGQALIENLLLSLKEELHDKKCGYPMMAAGYLTQLFILAKRFKEARPRPAAPLSPSPKHKQIGEIARYILEHFKEPLSLSLLAKRFYMNKSYLSRSFKEVTGFTITEYLHLKRISHAKTLLSESRLNISQISEAAGFETITYFERIFKKYTGTSPLRYRRENSQTAKTRP